LLKQQNSLKVKELKKVITPEQRGAINAIDYMQNQLWKPLALATGGYVVRNSLDAQVRMAFSELPSLITHPLQYIGLVTEETLAQAISPDQTIADLQSHLSTFQMEEEDDVLASLP
jgi:hypothetical protein